MGLCSSSDADGKGAPSSPEEQKRDKELAKELGKAEMEDKKVKKLLLLGAGASGKSTLFKQMNTIYGSGFSEAQRNSYSSIIFQNIFSSIRLLILNCPHYTPTPPSSAAPFPLPASLTSSPFFSALLTEPTAGQEPSLSVEVGHFISLLWQQNAIQQAYLHGDEFQLPDSAKYFFDSLDRVSSVSYVPTEQDVLRSRAPTTGIVENHFLIEGNHFSMFDVGGQRNERKKWIHCFEHVTAVLFVAALSEYNQVLFEDNQQNRLIESWILFGEICQTKYLAATSMVLFLNKRDIFLEKLPLHPLKKSFPEYPGRNTEEEAARWIKEKFEERNPNRDRQIYTHITCATDQNNVRVVFEAVKDIILRQNLEKAFGIS